MARAMARAEDEAKKKTHSSSYTSAPTIQGLPARLAVDQALPRQHRHHQRWSRPRYHRAEVRGL